MLSLWTTHRARGGLALPPPVPRLHAVGTSPGVTYAEVFPYTLATFPTTGDEGGRRAHAVCLLAAEALQVMHDEYGIVVVDLRASTVMVEVDQAGAPTRVVFASLELARPIAAVATAAGAGHSSIAMAPEELGSRPAAHGTAQDVFALAMALTALFTSARRPLVYMDHWPTAYVENDRARAIIARRLGAILPNTEHDERWTPALKSRVERAFEDRPLAAFFTACLQAEPNRRPSAADARSTAFHLLCCEHDVLSRDSSEATAAGLPDCFAVAWEVAHCHLLQQPTGDIPEDDTAQAARAAHFVETMWA